LEECYQRWLQHELSHLEKYDPPFANEEAFRNHFEGWNEVGARYYPIFIQFIPNHKFDSSLMILMS